MSSIWQPVADALAQEHKRDLRLWKRATNGKPLRWERDLHIYRTVVQKALIDVKYLETFEAHDLNKHKRPVRPKVVKLTSWGQADVAALEDLKPPPPPAPPPPTRWDHLRTAGRAIRAFFRGA